MHLIPYGRQSVDQSDIDAVVGVLRSDWLTQGPAIPAFEAAVASYCDARRAVAVCNATAALHISCMALGLGPGDVLWTSPITFVASANCALYCGASVDFVDIDPDTYNMSAASLERKLKAAALAGRLPKIVVPVHFSGQSCDMESIGRLAKEYGFKVIEDASHAIGGLYKGKKIGNCSYSDITVFSLHPVKIITTGEGGLVLTNNDDLHHKLLRLRSHGITREHSLMDGPSEGEWYYQQIDLGYNYRMTDIQAALGLSQLARLDSFIAQRRALAQRYDEALQSKPFRSPWQDASSLSAWHLYCILVEDSARKSRKYVFDSLRAAGILANVHYIPVHLQPFYRSFGFKPKDFPNSEAYYRRTISLPMFADLSSADQDFVIQTLQDSIA